VFIKRKTYHPGFEQETVKHILEYGISISVASNKFGVIKALCTAG